MNKSHKEKLNKAIQTVFDELNALSTEELQAEINKHAEKEPEKVMALYRAFNLVTKHDALAWE